MLHKPASSVIMNLAHELQKRELHVDAYLKPVTNDNETYNDHIYDDNQSDFNSITMTKRGFPAHKLLLAAVSPFFKALFQDHYSDHRESCVTVLLPETSAFALRHVIRFVYTTTIDIPSSLHAEVLHLAKVLQINSLLLELDPDAKIQNNVSPTKNEVSPLMKKKRGRNKKCSSVHFSNNFALNSRQQRTIKCKYDSDVYELHSPQLRREKNTNYSSNILLSNSKEIATDSNGDCQLNIQENGKESRQSDSEQNVKEIIPEESSTDEPVQHNSKYWINPRHSSDVTRNLLYVEPNHKAENIIIFTNTVNSSQNLLNSVSLPPTSQSILFPVNSEIQATLPLELPQKSSSNLALVDLPSVLAPSESFPEISYPVSAAPSSSLPVENMKEHLLRNSEEEEQQIQFNSDSEEQVGNFEPTEVELQRCHNQQQEEEEKLKLQVLLKECEGIDFGGRSFTDTAVKHSISPHSISSSSEDFTDKINQWIHCDSLKTLKNFKETPVETNGVKQKEKYLSDEGSKEEIPSPVDSVHQIDESEKERKIQSLHDVKGSVSEADHRGKEVKKNFPCKKCKFTATSKSDLILHKKDHKEKVLKCRVCSKVFKPRSAHDLLLHEARHNTPTLPCKICSKVFKVKKDLNAHMKRHENEPRFKCEKCDKRLSSRRNLKMHIAKIHENKKLFNCEFCSKAYGKQASLKVHIRSIHTRERPYKCPSCSKAFASSELLAVHKAIHSNSFRYICAVCKKGFNSFANLYSHKKVHLKEKSYFCNVCKLQFKCQLTLLKHKLTHKRLSQPLKCRHCDHTFDIKESYEMHMFSVHKERVKIAEINMKKMHVQTATDKTILQVSAAKESLNPTTKDVEIQNFNLPSKAISSENNKIESTFRNCLPLKIVHWPLKLTNDATHLNSETISASPTLKLKLNEPMNSLTFLKTPASKSVCSEAPTSCVNKSIKVVPSNVTENFITPLNNDYLQCTTSFRNKNYVKETDQLLQISDIHFTNFPPKLLNSNSKDNAKLWPNEESKSNSFRGDERNQSKWSNSSVDYKLTEHINSLPYNLHEEVSFDTNNCDKSESNFLDTFSSKFSSEEDNVEKFLFEDISSCVE